MQASTYEPGNRGFSSAALKWIAVLTMLIDHIAAALIEPKVGGLYLPATGLALVDLILRSIGRLAFPIYLFLLAEGLFYTRSRVKYALRLLLLLLLSEIPFDLAFHLTKEEVHSGILIETAYQNVFLELLIGFLCLVLLDFLRTGFIDRKIPAAEWVRKIPAAARFIAGAAAVILFAFIAERLNADYEWMGVVSLGLAYAVKLRYAARDENGNTVILVPTGKQYLVEFTAILLPLIAGNALEAAALIDLVFISRYSGARGKRYPKWFFYFFYPVHLLVLGLIRVFSGLF